MKYNYLVAAALSFLLGGTQSPNPSVVDSQKLSGNIRLTLKNGVWKTWQEKPVYQNLTLDLVCDQGQCDTEVWGYAPKFNQDVDHQGTVQVMGRDSAWRLKVDLKVQSHPWRTHVEDGTYELEVVVHQDKLLGSYRGKLNHRFLQGKVWGEVMPLWPTPLAHHQPIQPREHPRLIFRRQQLPALRQKAQTPSGQAILTQLKKRLNQPVYYEDVYVPTGGYHGAGHCFLSLLQEDPQAAETAWELVKTSMEHPGDRLLEHAPLVAGVALAYDLCYEAWNEARLKQVTRWLRDQASWLNKGDSPKKGWNGNAASNWNARARGAAGVAALAILDEPDDFFDQPVDGHHLYKQAQRHVQRYLTTAIGDRGFGAEGDLYTTEPFVLTILPFLQAYRNVIGKDLIQGSGAEWLLPHYWLRTIVDQGKLAIPAYGRHRHYAGGSLFAMGLGSVPADYFPPVMAFYRRYLGPEGDRSFGILYPHEAIYALAGYREHTRSVTEERVSRVLVDERHGFYGFRNQWHDSNDFVASLYLKKQTRLGGWSFPEVGSFRIWGLGGQWATVDQKSGGSWTDENVVVMPKTRPWKISQPIFFQSRADGSGIVSLRTDSIVRPNSQPPVGISLLRSFAVDYSRASGAPGLFVVADRFIGARADDAFAEKVWLMHTNGKVTLAGQRFMIQAPNQATMQGVFIAPSRVKLAFETGDRGGTIKATGGDDFLVVMTVQQGPPPPVTITGEGLFAQVRVGKQDISFQGDKIYLSQF